MKIQNIQKFAIDLKKILTKKFKKFPTNQKAGNQKGVKIFLECLFDAVNIIQKSTSVRN